MKVQHEVVENDSTNMLGLQKILQDTIIHLVCYAAINSVGQGA